MSLISASGLSLYYGDTEVFSGVDLEVAGRARIGIVGPNGGGKTSLLRVLVGELSPTSGIVTRASGLRMGYVPQVATLSTGGTLKDEVMLAFQRILQVEGEIAASALEIQWSQDAQRRQAERRYASLLQEFESLGGYDYQSRMERVVAGVGLSPEALATPVASASGGERTRAALARALLSDPDLLVLDEPTNYLDFHGLTWLEEFLGRFPHAFIVVSHDRYFLDRAVDQVWELDHGRLQVFPGNYTRYRALKVEQVKRQQREYQRQQEFIAREEEFIRRYRAGQRAREARGRATRLDRLERLEAPERDQTVSFSAGEVSRTGQVVLSTHGLRVGFVHGDRRTELLAVPDVKLERGSRTALIGDNGIGKTTLVETLLGLTPPVSGAVRLGQNVRTGYYRQGLDDLPAGSTVLDALLEARNIPVSEARSYLARFLFRGDDVYKLVGSLSGGERSRLALARLLITEPNFLVLDEPTTHLDIPSREALEQVLLSFEGTLLFVSHDRQLISLLAQQLWTAEGGAVRVFPGPFDQWVRTKQEPAPRAASAPRETPRRSPQAQKKQQAQTAEAGPEQVIPALEEVLRDLERQLEEASQRQDIAQIARLGEEYARTQARLQKAWEEWASQDQA